MTMKLSKLFTNSAKRIYPFEIKRVRRITSFSGNELATVPIAVVCIALLVQVTLRMQRYKNIQAERIIPNILSACFVSTIMLFEA